MQAKMKRNISMKNIDQRKKRKIASSSSRASEEGTGSSPPQTELPVEILREILLRTSIKSLLSCMSVCKKPFLGLISHPTFASLHFERSPTCILIHIEPNDRNSRDLIMNHVVENEEQEKEASGSNNRHRARLLVDERLKFVTKTNLPNSYHVRVVNSCNGLLCLSIPREKGVQVCNPILGEHINVLVPDKDPRTWYTFALGFSPNSNQFKVIRTHSDGADIYTLGEARWRDLGKQFYRINDLDFDTYVNGSIHWFGGPDRRLQIFSFSFDSEEFNSLALPDLGGGDASEYRHLGVQKDSLWVTSSRDWCAAEFDIWVMSEYGVEESWTKQFVIRNPYVGYRHHQPLLFMNSGNILMLCSRSSVVCYDTKRESFGDTEILLCQRRKYAEAFAYRPSLVSLEHVAEGENVKKSRFMSKRRTPAGPGLTRLCEASD